MLLDQNISEPVCDFQLIVLLKSRIESDLRKLDAAELKGTPKV